jgi:hypothetical protein
MSLQQQWLHPEKQLGERRLLWLIVREWWPDPPELHLPNSIQAIEEEVCSVVGHGGRDGVPPGLADALKRQCELTNHLEARLLLGLDDTQPRQLDAVDPAQRGEVPACALLHGDECPPGAFGEKPHERISLGWQLDARTQPVPERGLDQGLR